MTGRERLLTALRNETPDRMPCQVHSWMRYYLETYLDGMDQYAAYEHFGIDPVVYVAANYQFDDASRAQWEVVRTDMGTSDGTCAWREEICTPDGVLTIAKAKNAYTEWYTKYPIESKADFEIWNRYVPTPVAVDWTPVLAAKDRVGDRGIVRGWLYDYGQGSPWQSFCYLCDTERAIMLALDEPEWMHTTLEALIQKKLQVIELAGAIPYDLVETGGGAGSSTVISPNFHREFCLPYDQRQHEALHLGGTRVVYHLCGGLMPLLETVVDNGTDALETMTPPGMGGDCDLVEATRRIGDKLAFIGGFDQNAGFERGTPAEIRAQVFALHAACPRGGYICSPSDHFFFGDPANVQA
ncbi:MAG: uroporphyrinogen decarboxylase family protein, partial [bacterium]